MRRIKIKTFIKAMAKNGYPKARHAYIVTEHDGEGEKIIAACAFGQAAINLNMDPSDLHDSFAGMLDRFKFTSRHQYPDIMGMNDRTEMTVPEIAEKVMVWATDQKLLDKVIVIDD